MENTQQSVMRSGNLNPMWGHKQTSETKKKISDSQKARYAAIRKALSERWDLASVRKGWLSASRLELSFQK